jgi:hypothetical protein
MKRFSILLLLALVCGPVPGSDLPATIVKVKPSIAGEGKGLRSPRLGRSKDAREGVLYAYTGFPLLNAWDCARSRTGASFRPSVRSSSRWTMCVTY